MKNNFTRVNGINLHYVEEGEGELVILLHGFPEFWYGWRNQIPVLSQPYRVVAPDMRGYNLSDKPKRVKDYSVELLAGDIAELIKNLGGEKAIIVGHDWGGVVAWALALNYPGRVSKLAILNAPYPTEMKKALSGFNLAQWKKSYYMFLFQLPWLPEKFISKDLSKFFKGIFRGWNLSVKPVSDEEIARYVEAYKQPGALTAALNYYRAVFRYPGSRKSPRLLEMPVLMLWGEQDKALGKELTYHTKQYCKNFEIIYNPDAAHFIQLDKPGWVNEKLLDFFGR